MGSLWDPLKVVFKFNTLKIVILGKFLINDKKKLVRVFFYIDVGKFTFHHRPVLPRLSTYLHSSSKNFAFKCHRIENDIYAVNSIAFHPTFGTFATAGSDGTIHFWDKDSKQKLKGFNRCPAPITATTFNRDGTIFAYSVSYDWSKGHEHHNPNSKNYIFLHATEESEVRPKKK
jgi:WD40 repeat protein